VLDQFKAIVETQQKGRVVPFLKSLTNSQRKELAPLVKKLTKEYSVYSQDASGAHRQKGSGEQLEILQVASFVCLNMADYEKSPFSVWFLEDRSLGKIIDWFCPDWFSEFVNKQAKLDHIPYYINYNRVMELTEKGYLQPSKDLVAKIMPQSIFEQDKDRHWVFKPENLLKQKVTIDEHIWYLFEVETNLHYSDRFLYFGKEESKEKIGWLTLFKQFSEEKRLDRFRLLKESLLASNRNFNKVLSGWFIELFNQLEPTNGEIMALQTEMYTVLSSPHSKPIGTVLQCFKKVLAEPNFGIDNFLDSTPVLLSSSTKSIVASTLAILEKLASKSKDDRFLIAKSVMQIFIHPDDDLQAKAARIIADNQKEPDEFFKSELSVYFPTMMLSAKNILKRFDRTSSEVKPIKSEIKPNTVRKDEWTEIPPIENFDDLVFLASQAFDNNQSWHIDWLPAALVQFQNEIRGENIDKLEPALQRGLKMTKSEFRSTQGYLDHMLAVFFIDVCVFLAKKYPQESNALRLLFGKFDQKEGDKIRRWLAIGDKKSYLSTWDNYAKDPCYDIYKQFLLSALEKIRIGDTIPQLPTPTHEPGWILPETLVKRLVIYQKENVEPNGFNFQMAISRCLLENTDNAIEIAKAQLTNEYRNLMVFLLDINAEPQPPFNHPGAWMVASLSKGEKKAYKAFEKFDYYQTPFQKYTGQYQWQSVDEEYIFDEFNYKLKKSIPVKRRRKILQVDFTGTKPKENKAIPKFLTKLVAKHKSAIPLLYDLLSIEAAHLDQHHNDARRILLLTPNNPEPFLAVVLNQCLKYPTFWNESDKRMVIACLQTLHEIWNDFGNMAHVFLGTCMLASDRTVSNIAGEIWVKAVNIGKISNEQLGKAIGLHERIEFAPLKRFTDLVSQNMFRVSDLHNQQLQILIEHILVELPDEPIKNLKKLVEIYAEVLSLNQSGSNEKAIERLNVWKSTAGLNKVIKGMVDGTYLNA